MRHSVGMVEESENRLEEFLQVRPTVGMARLDRNGRHHHRGPGDVVYGSGCQWSTCCLAGAVAAIIAVMQGDGLRTRYTALDDVGARTTLRVPLTPTSQTQQCSVRQRIALVHVLCCRHRPCGPEDVVYGDGYRMYENTGKLCALRRPRA